jgi:hypothetical protein
MPAAGRDDGPRGRPASGADDDHRRDATDDHDHDNDDDDDVVRRLTDPVISRE